MKQKEEQKVLDIVELNKEEFIALVNKFVKNYYTNVTIIELSNESINLLKKYI